MTYTGILSVTLFLPVVTGLIIFFFAKSKKSTHIAAFIGSFVTLALSIAVFFIYDSSVLGVQMVEHISLFEVGKVKINYLLGVDGLSVPLVLLNGLLGFAACIGSFGIAQKRRQYFLWLFMLQSAVFGVFMSLDFLLFFVFFEFEVLPMFMLLSLWGSGRKHYSALKFVIFTLAGGAFMLVGIAALLFTSGIESLSLVAVEELGLVGLPALMSSVTLVLPTLALFLLFFVAFAIKLPIWPLHNWLPDAHTDAPTAVSVMLAGVLLKMGGYGLYRVNLGLFQNTSSGFQIHDVAEILSWIGAISVVYGAFVTLRQTDVKRMIAYSSVSHMGFVTLGFAAVASSKEALSVIGLTGGALQLFTHGVITGLLFLTVGMVYDRVHTRHIPHLGALAPKLPIIATLFMFAGLASLGLPMLAGFVAELSIFLGTFKVWPIQTAIAAFGIVLAAGYVLWANQRVLFGQRPKVGILSTAVYENLPRIKRFELVAGVTLLLPIILVGVFPSLITDIFEAGIRNILGGN